MDKIISILVALVVPTVAFAQVDALQMRGNTLSVVNPASTPGAVKIVAGSSGVEQWVGGSKIATTDANGVALESGKAFKVPVYVPTMAATPVVGTNQFQPGLNVVPTAAASTAAFLGAATPVPGQHFVINNGGPNSVFIKAAGGATLNGATAGGKIALPTLATVECFTATTGNQVCLQPVVPTPAAP